MRALGTLGALLLAVFSLTHPAHADGLSITVCDQDATDAIQDALALQGLTLLHPEDPCVDGVTIIDPDDQGWGYTAEAPQPWWATAVVISVSDPAAVVAIHSAVISLGRVPPSGPSIIQFTETYDVGPLPIK